MTARVAEVGAAGKTAAGKRREWRAIPDPFDNVVYTPPVASPASSKMKFSPREGRRRARPRPRKRDARRRNWRWRVVELLLLSSALLILLISALGRAAQRLSGAGTWVDVLSFAALVLSFGLAGGLLLRAWRRSRGALARWQTWLPPALALLLATAAGWYASRPAFRDDLDSLRTLLGGRAAAERRTLAHQVFATYRRTPPEAWERMLARAASYEKDVVDAAHAFGVDPEVLMGVAAAESGFVPRDSRDGGRGLFQITAPPSAAQDDARSALGVAALDLAQPRQNTYLAAATLRVYLAEMNGDVFLGLLAYNIGPRNGGLRAIMEQYGARDFVTAQPYLRDLPRDYPVRVLAAALAYRLQQREGKLPHYEEGENAARVQRIGIPGLSQD